MAKRFESDSSTPPVLLVQADLEHLSEVVKYRQEFYVEEIDEVLEAKRRAGQNAILEAATILLTQSAVAIVHVDITKQRKSYVPNDRRKLYETDDYVPIGFNDHGGGSESRFKILLNGSPDDLTSSYVLYSPPNAEGKPSNTTFHRADFTFLPWEPKGQYRGSGHVPNPLKTSGSHRYSHQGESNYRKFLFGGPDTPRQVYEAFAAAGFEFEQSPYDDNLRAPEGVVTTWTLRDHEDVAREALGYRGSHFWPGDQFAENLKLLGIEPPKFSPEDYPLVRPENKV